MLLINEIKLALEDDEKNLPNKIAKKLRNKDFKFEIYRISLDCRNTPYFSYSVIVDIKNEDRYLKIPGISKYTKENLSPKYQEQDKEAEQNRQIIKTKNSRREVTANETQ